MSTLYINCSCGQTSLSLASTAPRRHIVCYCRDCQSFARHLDKTDMLDAQGGTHICQSVPGDLHVVRGQEHIRALRLSPKGLLRWYAACCDTPLANTLPKTTLPFVGLIGKATATDFGAVKGHVQTAATRGAVKEHGYEAAGLTIIGRAIGAYAKGKTRSPFFTPEGAPITTPKVLSLAERNAARPGPG